MICPCFLLKKHKFALLLASKFDARYWASRLIKKTNELPSDPKIIYKHKVYL